MKKELISYLQTSALPFPVLVDESTRLSSKTALIIYIRVAVDSEVCNYFYDLLEIDNGATGSNIVTAIFDSLKETGLVAVSKNFIGFATDGASVMRGEKAGAGGAILRSLAKADFKSFHCMAHKMELAVNMATKTSGEVQRFRMFVDTLYAFYHRSPKNAYELRSVAGELSMEILKVSQVFTVRWVASCYRAVKALETDFSALFTHLNKSSQEQRRSSQERSKCAGLARKMSSWGKQF